MTQIPGAEVLLKTDSEILEKKDGSYYLYVKSPSTGKWDLLSTATSYRHLGALYCTVARIKGKFKILPMQY